MSVFPFSGVIQHYAWGGYEYLPSLLDKETQQDEPWAELWLGAHHKGPGVLDDGLTLDQIVEDDPTKALGPRVVRRFGQRLPFLMKILDVREMLSIQVHPGKRAAEVGFAAEEKNGPARDAPDRNFRDDNHKPELGVALTEFHLLHGFKEKAVIASTLTSLPGWASLSRELQKGGVEGLYGYVMAAEQEEIDELLQPLVDSLSGNQYTKNQPEFWAARAVKQYSKNGHHDRGIFSIFWFNLVKLSPGEGIFQASGIPHAYLEGVCIELMANSDNVLRGGLTPKHIDVPELLKHTSFDAVNPHKITEVNIGGWRYYPTPAADFRLSTASVEAGNRIAAGDSGGPEILFLMQGMMSGQELQLDTDRRALFLAAGDKIELTATAGSSILRATVGSLSE